MYRPPLSLIVVGAVLAVAAVLGIGYSIAEEVQLSAWTPGIGTEAISLLITVLVVAWIVERRDVERRRVHVVVAVDAVQKALLSLVLTLITNRVDPADREPDDRGEPFSFAIPIRRWRSGLTAENAAASEAAGVLIAFRRVAAAALDNVEKHDKVHEPEFLAATWIFVRATEAAENRYAAVGEDEAQRAKVLGMYADATVTYLEVFEPYVARWWKRPFSSVPAVGIQ